MTMFTTGYKALFGCNALEKRKKTSAWNYCLTTRILACAKIIAVGLRWFKSGSGKAAIFVETTNLTSRVADAIRMNMYQHYKYRAPSSSASSRPQFSCRGSNGGSRPMHECSHRMMQEHTGRKHVALARQGSRMRRLRRIRKLLAMHVQERALCWPPSHTLYPPACMVLHHIQ
jgi:hypothetical protein